MVHIQTFVIAPDKTLREGIHYRPRSNFPWCHRTTFFVKAFIMVHVQTFRDGTGQNSSWRHSLWSTLKLSVMPPDKALREGIHYGSRPNFPWWHRTKLFVKAFTMVHVQTIRDDTGQNSLWRHSLSSTWEGAGQINSLSTGSSNQYPA